VADLVTVVGIDPGRLRGTGLAHCGIGRGRRELWQGWSGIETAEGIVSTVSAWLDEDKFARGFVAIEGMAAMGPRAGLQKILDNAEFVGEIIGRLEERGERVVRLKKNEILRALGLKGKAAATRVRATVNALFGDVGPISDHSVDAVAAAFVGSMKGATR
jgi:Holliday junction resolvasome RuvABC endonuclease subunit